MHCSDRRAAAECHFDTLVSGRRQAKECPHERKPPVRHRSWREQPLSAGPSGSLAPSYTIRSRYLRPSRRRSLALLFAMQHCPVRAAVSIAPTKPPCKTGGAAPHRFYSVSAGSSANRITKSLRTQDKTNTITFLLNLQISNTLYRSSISFGPQ